MLTADSTVAFQLIGIEVGKLVGLQLVHSFGQYLLIGFVTQVGNEAALLCAEHITRAANVEVLHGDVDAAA